MSIAKLAVSSAVLIVTALTIYDMSLNIFAPIGYVYIAISLIDFSGLVPMGSQKNTWAEKRM